MAKATNAETTRIINTITPFEQFNKSSVNIIRLTTWRNGKDIVVFAPCVRFGVDGSVTDVAYVNGEEIINCVGINPDGQIMKQVVSLSGEKRAIRFDRTIVPRWTELIEAVKKGHSYLEWFDLVAWDMTVDQDDQIICIEYNLFSPGSIVYQMAHGPLAGDYTDDFLSFLLNERIQKHYLPMRIRIDKQ